MYASPFEEAATEAKAHGRVMVSARYHHLRAGDRKPFKGFIKEFHDVHGGKRPVIHIAGNQYYLNVMFADRLFQMVHEHPLRLQHADAVKGAAQMPVGRVQ